MGAELQSNSEGCSIALYIGCTVRWRGASSAGNSLAQ
jgi:hypothetical protein